MISHTALQWFKMLAGMSLALPSLLSALPGLLSVLPGLLSALPDLLSALPGLLLALPEAPRDEMHYADAVVSLTVKPKQHDPKHSWNHQLMIGDQNTDTNRPTMLQSGLAKVQACGLLNVQMLNILRAMILSDDCESNVKQAPELKKNWMDKQPVMVMEENKNDKNKDNEEQNDKEL